MLLVIKALLLWMAGKLLLRLLLLVRLLRRALCIALPEARNRRRTYGAVRLWVRHYKKLGNISLLRGNKIGRPLAHHGHNNDLQSPQSYVTENPQKSCGGNTRRDLGAFVISHSNQRSAPHTQAAIRPPKNRSMQELDEPIHLNPTTPKVGIQLASRPQGRLPLSKSVYLRVVGRVCTRPPPGITVRKRSFGAKEKMARGVVTTSQRFSRWQCQFE